jgi:hypothetical protein
VEYFLKAEAMGVVIKRRVPGPHRLLSGHPCTGKYVYIYRKKCGVRSEVKFHPPVANFKNLLPGFGTLMR